MEKNEINDCGLLWFKGCLPRAILWDLESYKKAFLFEEKTRDLAIIIKATGI